MPARNTGIQAGLPGFALSCQSAEQVDLPAALQAKLGLRTQDQRAGEGECCAIGRGDGLQAGGIGHTGGDGLGAGAGDVGTGLGQRAAVVLRRAQQCRQRAIVELLPPVAQLRRIAGMRQRCLPARGSLGSGALIVGAGIAQQPAAAATQQQQQCSNRR